MSDAPDPPAKPRPGRRLALWRARLAGLAATWRRALFDDMERLDDRAPGQIAEAKRLAEDAALLRGGIAKVGQLRAHFDESAPDARAKLAMLWDRVPGESPAQIRRVFIEEQGHPPSELFATWEEQPFAAASLGEVHAALDAHGQRLAVKVQYPDVAEALADDLRSVGLLRKIVGAELGGDLDRGALDVLRQSLLSELDYRKEAESLVRFAALWRDDPQIVLPRVVQERSSRRVLAMEHLDGRPLPALVDDPDELHRSAVAQTILRFAIGSPLLGGCFNADPHPGNYLVLDAAAGRVAVLDFGCVVAVEDKIRDADRKLWYALVVRDGEALRHAAFASGIVEHVRAFESEAWREWEALFAAPFLHRGPFLLEPGRIRSLLDVMRRLLGARTIGLPAPALMLWRQRLGVLSVLATLRPRFDFRRTVAELVDDHHHPTPLADRYR